MNKLIIAAASAAALSACSFSQDIARHAVEYNKTIEQAENEILLLNIVRASKGRPMYFSRLVHFDGSLKATAGFQGTLSELVTTPPAGGATDADTTSGVLSLGAETNPSFQIRPLDTKEFFSGFVQPLGPDAYDNYLRAGYQPSMLLPAFVEGAIITDDTRGATKRCKVFRNLDRAGGDRDAYLRFISFIADKRVPLSSSGPSAKTPTLKLPVKTAEDIVNLSKLAATGYAVEIGPDGAVRVSKRAAGAAAVTGPSTFPKSLDIPPKTCDDADLGAVETWFSDAKTRAERNVDLRNDEGLRIEFEFSSAEGVFFALGEMISSGLTARKDFSVFKLRKGAPSTRPAVEASLDGETYWIERNDQDSLAYLALARQLFSLNISAEAEAAFARQRIIVQ